MTDFDLHPSWLIFSGVALALLPLIIPLITGWTKITIILGFVRSGMGFQHTGAALVDGSLGLLIALTIAAPVSSKVFTDLEEAFKTVDFAKGPTLQQVERVKSILSPWESFLEKNSGLTELKIATRLTHPKINVSKQEQHYKIGIDIFRGRKPDDKLGIQFNLQSYLEELYMRESNVKSACNAISPTISSAFNRTQIINPQQRHQPMSTSFVPSHMLRPSIFSVLLAFFLTELREGLILGLKILVPFLIVDFVVANLLAGMGMFLLSPQVITLPLKVLLFIGAGGYTLLTQGAVLGYVY